MKRGLVFSNISGTRGRVSSHGARSHEGRREAGTTEGTERTEKGTRMRRCEFCEETQTELTFVAGPFSFVCYSPSESSCLSRICFLVLEFRIGITPGEPGVHCLAFTFACLSDLCAFASDVFYSVAAPASRAFRNSSLRLLRGFTVLSGKSNRSLGISRPPLRFDSSQPEHPSRPTPKPCAVPRILQPIIDSSVEIDHNRVFAHARLPDRAMI